MMMIMMMITTTIHIGLIIMEDQTMIRITDMVQDTLNITDTTPMLILSEGIIIIKMQNRIGMNLGIIVMGTHITSTISQMVIRLIPSHMDINEACTERIDMMTMMIMITDMLLDKNIQDDQICLMHEVQPKLVGVDTEGRKL